MAQLRLTSKGLVLLILIMSLVAFGLGFGVWQLAGPKTYNPTGSSAGQASCGDQTKQGDCNNTCSPNKGNANTSFKCKWINGACKESAQPCSGSGGSTGATACTNPNANTSGKKCNIGKTDCQEDSKGNHTGYNCECIDLSPNFDSCVTDWRCTTLDTKKCPTDSQAPNVGNCKVEGGCAILDNPVTYYVYYCKGQSLEEGSTNGCQHSAPDKVVENSNKVCPNKPAGFCGWIQADIVGSFTCHKSDGKLAENPSAATSWYYPCDEKPPVEEPPVTPPPVVNVCEGGLVSGPANSGNYNVGDKVVFKGSAYDKDGINKSKVVIKVDGVVVGNATVTDHPCASATADAVCTAAKGSPAVDWTYTYTVTTAGAHSFAATWEDTKGVTGASCQGSRSITANVQTNPAWEIEKSGAGVCLDETDGVQRARVDYTITITNVGDGTGQLEDLVDTLDSKVQESYITDSSITPSASVSGRVITWDLGGTPGQFDPDESKTFRYSIIIPESAFGTLTNTAVATPESGEAFQAVEIVTAICSPDGTPPPEVPDTALFDSAISKVILGVALIAISGAYLYSDSFNISFLGIKKIKKKSFEDRVAGE